MTLMVVEGEWILPTEAAKRLHVHVDTVRRWVDSGQLLGVRTPQGRMVEANAVERLRAEREAGDS